MTFNHYSMEDWDWMIGKKQTNKQTNKQTKTTYLS
jgi:hypothetical protein